MKKNTAPLLDVLFVDDEAGLRELMSEELPRMGCRVTAAGDGVEAVEVLKERHFDLVIVDLDMPRMGGIEVIGHLSEISPETLAIVLTGKATRESAIAALRLGAFDYLEKPCSLVEMRSRLQRARERIEMQRKITLLSRRLDSFEVQTEIIGQHDSMRQVFDLIARLAPTDSNVLVTGETGTGKELVARAIHDNSPRRDKAFLAVNCGSLPGDLIESELFGHRKGAFTGADENRQGLFEVADGGTLFLDEIGELPKPLQSRLLRVLESGEIRRVGDTRTFKVDVRIVTATHRDLEAMVRGDEFRQDLIYRINTFQIQLPPLRDRASDIPALFHALLKRKRKNVEPGKEFLTKQGLKLLEEWHWPGNIRELANVVEYANVLCDCLPIDIDQLPRYLTRSNEASFRQPDSGVQTLQEIEQEAILQAIDRHNGNKTSAAKELGISLKTLYNRLNVLQSRAA